MSIFWPRIYDNKMSSNNEQLHRVVFSRRIYHDDAVSRGVVRSAASCYAAMRMVAGSPPSSS